MSSAIPALASLRGPPHQPDGRPTPGNMRLVGGTFRRSPTHAWRTRHSASVPRHDHHLTALGTAESDPGTVDLTVSSDGLFLYAQTGGKGVVDAFRVGHDVRLTRTGAATVPDAVGGEGIAAL
jgi:hypothetical protein